MSTKKIRTLGDLGEAGMMVNDFKTTKDEYFRLKRQHRDLISSDEEVVDEDRWSDRSFEEEIKLFERRRALYHEAQQLFADMKGRLGEGG